MAEVSVAGLSVLESAANRLSRVAACLKTTPRPLGGYSLLQQSLLHGVFAMQAKVKTVLHIQGDRKVFGFLSAVLNARSRKLQIAMPTLKRRHLAG